MKKLLCLCDTPAKPTGFGRVAKNLITRWAEAGAFPGGIDVWGIGHEGYPHSLPCQMFPAAAYSMPRWEQQGNLSRFLRLLAGGSYTHLWMMQDTFQLAGIAPAVSEICAKMGIRSVLYFPVDAPLDPEWVAMPLAVDVPVAYTEYGRAMALDAVLEHERSAFAERLRVIPHGVDPAFHSLELGEDERLALRQELFQGHVAPDDLLVMNVNSCQRRKGIYDTLLVFQHLCRERQAMRQGGVKLYLHMRSRSPDEGMDWLAAVHQMGLRGQVMFPDEGIWPFGTSDETLNRLYNAADIMLTTTHGEGWGLSITEAMAAGCLVAAPDHTSCQELLEGVNERRGIPLPCARETVMLVNDNNRIRPRVSAQESAEKIAHWLDEETAARVRMNAREFAAKLDWDAIAKDWLEVLS